MYYYLLALWVAYQDGANVETDKNILQKVSHTPPLKKSTTKSFPEDGQEGEGGER